MKRRIYFKLILHVKVREYHRLKEQASKKASRLLQELDSINREQKSDQDRLDNQGRKNTDINAKIKQKEQELEDNIQRVNKLNEYIKYVFMSCKVMFCI